MRRRRWRYDFSKCTQWTSALPCSFHPLALTHCRLHHAALHVHTAPIENTEHLVTHAAAAVLLRLGVITGLCIVLGEVACYWTDLTAHCSRCAYVQCTLQIALHCMLLHYAERPVTDAAAAVPLRLRQLLGGDQHCLADFSHCPVIEHTANRTTLHRLCALHITEHFVTNAATAVSLRFCGGYGLPRRLREWRRADPACK